MPPVPSGRRYFHFALTLIMLWLLQMVALAGWYVYEQVQEVSQVKAAHEQREEIYFEAQKKVADHQAFMNRYGPDVRYREAVQQLEEGRLLWSNGLQVVNQKLPAGTELFRAEVDARRMDGWAVFPSGDEAAAFLESLQSDSRVKSVFLDCLGDCGGDDALLDPDAEGEEVLHFHFTLKPSDDGSTPPPSRDSRPPSEEMMQAKGDTDAME